MGVHARPTKQPSDLSAGSYSVFARRRAPTDGEGVETARLQHQANVAASDYSPARHCRPSVKFNGSGGRAGEDDTDSGDSDGSSIDIGFNRGPRPHRRKALGLELPALLSGSPSAKGASFSGSGSGVSGGAAAAAGPAGVTLACLESLRAASRPEATLRDLYSSLVLPATRAARCAYVGLLGADHRAPPTHVLVCSWDERLSDVVDCLADHAAAAAATTLQQQQQEQGGVSASRLALRRSVEQQPTDPAFPFATANALASCPAAGLSGQWGSCSSRSPSPGPSPGGLSAAGQPFVAVWLDLFAINFHPPAPAGGAAAAAYGAAARLACSTKSYMPSLEDAAVERARELPAAIASIRSVLLLPGAHGAGLRDPAVTLAAWYALRGRGCGAGAALALAAPADVDVALLQAAFDGLAVSGTKAVDDSAVAEIGGGVGGFEAPEASLGASNRPPSPTCIYSSPDRLAVRAAREGAAGVAASAAAIAAIYAVDPLPSRTVREGLGAAATAAANALLARPVGLSSARSSLMHASTLLPPAPTATPALMSPSTPPTASPTQHPHTVLQGRSFSVNALEMPYSPSPLSTSRLSLLSSLRPSSSTAGALPSGRQLPPAGTAWSPLPSPSPSLSPVPPAAAIPGFSPPAASAMVAAAASLLSTPSGRLVSTASPLRTQTCAGLGGDEDCDGDGGGGEGSRGGWPALHGTAAAAGGGAGGAVTSVGEAPAAPRRLPTLVPPLDVSSPSLPSLPSLPSPSALPPVLSPSCTDHPSGAGSGRFVKLRNSAVAPWEASSPLPTLPFRSPSGPAVSPDSTAGRGSGSGGGNADDYAATAAVPATPSPPPPPSASQPVPACLSPLLPLRNVGMETPTPLSQPLPRLAPLQLQGTTLPLPTAASAASVSAAALAAATTATDSWAASAPLPTPLPYRGLAPALGTSTTEDSTQLHLVTPFGRIRNGHLFKSATARSGRCGREGGAAAAGGGGVCVGGGSSGVAAGKELDLDRHSGFEENSDPDSDDGGIVLDSLSSFLAGQGNPVAAADRSETGRSPPAVQHHLYDERGSGGDGSSHAGSKAPAGAAAPEQRPRPSVDSPPLYDPAPYRPLAPELARLVGMGRLLAALGQPATALRVVRHALAAARSFHGSNHPDSARCAAALGCLILTCHKQQLQKRNLAHAGLGGRTAAAAAAGSGGSGSGAGARRGRSPPHGGRDRPVGSSAPGEMLRQAAASPSRRRPGPGPPPLPPQDICGSLEEAEGLLRGASAVLERFLGLDNEETLAARQGLAGVLAAGARHDEAVPLLQRGVAGHAARRRPLSELALGSALNLATSLAAMGQAKEARRLLRAQLVRLQVDENEAAALAAAAAMAPGRGGRLSVVATCAGAPPLPSTSSGSLFTGRPSYSFGGAVSGPGSGSGSGCGSPVGAVQVSPSSSTGGGGQSQQPPALRGLTSLKREELRAQCAHRLAQLKESCGKAQAARILYRRAVQSYCTVYGRSHPVTADCMLGLAALSRSVREYGEALELYRAVLDLYVEMYGPYHPVTTRVGNQLGDLEEQMEDEEEGREEEDKAAAGGSGGSLHSLSSAAWEGSAPVSSACEQRL